MSEHEVEVGSAANDAEAEALVRQLADAGIMARARAAASSGLLGRIMGGKSGRVSILVPVSERRRAAQALRQRRVT